MDVLGSVDFGDWLIGQLALKTSMARAGDARTRKAARERIAALESTKQVLLEYLTLQDTRLITARHRSHNRARQPCH
jgi:hypothetical protein